VNNFLLFIDTEASGLPKNWKLPYYAEDNWPYSVQVGWVIYTKDGNKVKEQNFYINNSDFEISKSATKVHGLTKHFLKENGTDRLHVMRSLAVDIKEYNPLVVGHFMEFDFHMLAVDFYRSGIENPVKRDATFCTMIGSKHLVKNPAITYFRLGQLYETLFDKPLANQHNAIEDAKATARCFFELLKRGEINEEIIKQQQKSISEKSTLPKPKGCALPILAIISLTFLIFYYL
jgi:DNA polymerase-3 subunit epsilon